MPELRELKQLITDGKATLVKVPEVTDGGITIPASLKIVREKFNPDTGERIEDQEMVITKGYLEDKKTKLEDELAVVNQALNKLK